MDQTRQEFYVEGRILHTPQFATPSGRARLHCHALPQLAGGERQLRLMTVRSEGQFNTVVYEQEDIYRGQERRDVVLLHPDDLRRFGLQAGAARDRPESGRVAGAHSGPSRIRRFGRATP